MVSDDETAPPLGTWIHRIVKLSPLVHPNLSNSGGVV